MSDVTIPQPTRPWQRKRADSARSAISIGLVGVISFVIVLFTGFAGVDGWAVTVFLVSVLLIIIRGRKLSTKERGNAKVQLFITAAALLAFAPWISIFGSVLVKGIVGLKLNFVTSDMRTTVPDDELNMGGALHAMLGSMMMVLIATAITLPLGILSGVYLTEIKGRFTFLVRFVIQSMSGVPSIVAGLFVFTTYVSATHGPTAFGGSLALGILMLPTVARTSEEVLKLVPDDLRSASLALGARQWRTTLMVVLPTVRSGLITAAILGVARVIGETAPLLLTAGSSTAFGFNPIKGPIASLPIYVFGMLQIGTEYAVNRAWTGALVLMLAVFALFFTARKLGGKDKR
jgi:phosphate transport system permease protein